FGGTTTISPKGKTGFFIAKYNTVGDFQWVKHGGNYYTAATGTAYANSVKTDNEGNIYVSAMVMGMYEGWVWDKSLPEAEQFLGKAYYEETEISGNEFYTGNHNVLIMLSPEGKLLWKIVDGINIYYNDMAVDNDMNVYLTGGITGTTSMNGQAVSAKGLRDIVVKKINSKGETQWLKLFGADGITYNGMAVDLEMGDFICVDKSNNVYFAGIHYDGAKFDDITVNTDAALGDLKVGNIFVAKLNPDGKVQWVKNADSDKSAAAITGLVCDNEGNTYMSAVIGLKKASFDGIKARGAFLAKFDSAGNVVWVNDADKSDFWSSTKVEVNLPGGLAISHDNNYLYASGNAVKKQTSSNYMSGITTITTESIVAISKVETK
ncbi:MAG: hypothetical protein ABIJ97_04820, partial [Bacteroidota bacterium]